MTKFIASIELFNANETDYVTLGKALEAEYFKLATTTKPTSKGVAYKIEGNSGLLEIGSLVSKITSGICEKYAFTIIKEKPAYENMHLKKNLLAAVNH
jgi:hypothetical protein